METSNLPFLKSSVLRRQVVITEIEDLDTDTLKLLFHETQGRMANLRERAEITTAAAFVLEMLFVLRSEMVRVLMHREPSYLPDRYVLQIIGAVE